MLKVITFNAAILDVCIFGRSFHRPVDHIDSRLRCLAPAEELRHTSKGFYHLQAELPKVGTVNFINFHMSAGGKHAHPEALTDGGSNCSVQHHSNNQNLR